MFKTKRDVDRHVRTALSKLRSDNEKNLRGLTIAKLYFKIHEYATAQHYLSNYLSVKEECAQAHKLLGQCYQQLKKTEKSLSEFERSLELEPKQSDLLIEICQMFQDQGEKLDINRARYWCDLAESQKIQHDAVFSLRLKLLNKDNLETKQIEDLIHKEIASRPTDPNLRVRIIKHFIEQNKITEAFKYAHDLEMKHHDTFSNCMDWYNVIWLVLTKYKQQPNAKKTWEFWLLVITCLERQVDLSFSNTTSNLLMNGGINETSNLLFNFDQTLYEASQCVLNLCPERELAAQFLYHFRGQLCLHAAALIYKKEQVHNKNQWREATKNALPLLLLAFHCGTTDVREPWLKHSGEQTRHLIQLWSREGSFRCTQAGRTLLSCIDNSRDESLSSQVHNVMSERSIWSSVDDILAQVRQFCSDNGWRSKIFRLLFPSSDQLIKLQTSNIVNCEQFSEPTYELPKHADIEGYEEIAQYLKPQSLSHMVYLSLGVEHISDVRCKYFNGLSFSLQNLAFCGAESLNQLDIESFLYAATIQAKRMFEVERHQYDNYNAKNIGRPIIMPYANMSAKLCSEEQSNWWMSAYQVYKNLTGDNLAELRANLQYGIEAVRGVNGPKIDLIIILKLGKIFSIRSQDATKPIEKGYLDARALNLYKYALNMLKMHSREVLEPFRKLFKYSNANSPPVERDINILAEEAVTSVAASYFKNAEYEECIEELSGIQLPFATYFQAEAYRKLDESNKTPKKSKKLYSDKAKDCLNQTLNLLGYPNVDTTHPLSSVVHSEMKRMQYTDMFTEDGINSNDHNDSIGYNQNKSKREVVVVTPPKTAELENLIKQMLNTLSFVKDELVDVIKPDVTGIKKEMLSLKEKLATIEENMKKRSDPPSRDDATNVLEDLYIIGDEIQNQMYGNQHNAFTGYNQAQAPTPQNLRTSHTQPPQPTPNLYNNALYNTNYPINYYPQYVMPGAPTAAIALQAAQRTSLGLGHNLPFVDQSMNFGLQSSQQAILPPTDTATSLLGLLTQERTAIEKPVVPVVPAANSVPAMWNRLYNNAPVEKVPPVNVVITSSDPLPAPTTVSMQSTLSVTIPPQHIKPSIVSNDMSSTIQQAASTNFPIITQSVPFISSPFTPSTATTFSTFTPSTATTFSTFTPSTTTTFSTFTPSAATTLSNPLTTLSTLTKPNAKDDTPVKNNTIEYSTPKANESVDSDNQNKSTETEYDPRPDFKAIIPLPDEIEVKTGEEDEEVLFCSRAKLLRHADKEWKERGIGDMKILKNKLDGKIRILMRRDQTHKICANHLISPEINITQAKGDEKSYIWGANDFADEVLKVEKLCVRFKHAETAKEFYIIFTKSQKESSATETSRAPLAEKKPEVNETEKKPVPSFGGLAKSNTFSFANTSTPNKPEAKISSPAITPFATKTPFSSLSIAPLAKENKEPDTTKPSPFASFSFTNSIPSKSEPIIASTPFANIFSSKSSLNIENTVVAPKIEPPTISDNNKDNISTNKSETEEDDYVPTAQFKPAIPLPDLIEVQTGEENENILFEHRAKLLRYNKPTNEWKERGLGNMRLLVDKNDVNRVRLVMRREQIFKLCCNQRLTKDMKFKKVGNTDTTLSWVGQDYSENELQTEVLAIRFKTPEICKSFHDAVLMAQKNMTANESDKKPEEPKKPGFSFNFGKPKETVQTASTGAVNATEGFGDKFKPKPGSWSCTACYTSNTGDILYCVACENPKDDTVPKKSIPNILGNSNSVTPKSSFSFGFLSNKPVEQSKPVKDVEPVQGFGDKFKPKLGSWSCTACYTSNTEDILYCVACENPKDDTVPKKSISNILGNSNSVTPKSSFSFGFLSNKPVEQSKPVKDVKPVQGFGDEFKPKAGAWSCNGCYLSNDASALYCTACEAPKDDTVPKKEPKSLFDTTTSSTKFSFGFAPSGTAVDLSKPPTTQSFSFGNGFSFSTTATNVNATQNNPLSLFSNATSTSSSSPSPFSFSMNSSPLFGTQPADNAKAPLLFSNQNISDTAPNGESGFKLEKQQFSFVMKPKSPGKGKSPTKSTAGVDDEDDDGDEVEEEENNTYFTPVIPLPDKVEVKTGEEDEDILYCHRAKLYRYVDSEWKERGIGDVKILRHKETKKLRVVMRRELIFKICLNHVLNDDIEYKPKDDKSWHFLANDFSEGEIQSTVFSLRFKTKEIAEEFMDAVKSALAGDAIPITISNNDVSLTTESNVNSNISDENKKLAEELHLPSNYFDTSTTNECPGCRGCDPDSFTFPDYKDLNKEIIEEKVKAIPLEPPKPISPPLNKSGILKQSILSIGRDAGTNYFSNSNAFLPNNQSTILNNNQSSVQTSTDNKFTFSLGELKPEKTENTENKFLSGGFLFGNSQTAFGSADKAKPIFGQTSIFGNVNTSQTSILIPTDTQKIKFGNSSELTEQPKDENSLFSGNFSFGKSSGLNFGANAKPNFGLSINNMPEKSSTFENSFGSLPNAFGNVDNKEKTEQKDSLASLTEPIFKNDPGLSFATLAAASSSQSIPAFQTTSNTFGGFVGLKDNDAFKSFLIPATDKNNSHDGNDTQEDSNYDPHYEPIISLPDEIVVSTGEEDEEKLFGDRAVLYRYDTTNKEWKERGTGELKILYHPEKGTYRLLLRREQIHKLVLNHAISADLQFKPMNSSGKSYCWAAINYAEEPSQLEKLAARFKNVDIAQRFASEVNKCIEQAKTRADLEPEQD